MVFYVTNTTIAMKTPIFLLTFVFTFLTSAQAQDSSDIGPRMDIRLLDIKQEDGFVSIAVPEPDTTVFLFFLDNGEALPISGYVGKRKDGTPDISFSNNSALVWVDSIQKLMYGLVREVKWFAYRRSPFWK